MNRVGECFSPLLVRGPVQKKAPLCPCGQRARLRCTTFVYRNRRNGFLTASLRLPSESHPLTGMGREDLLKAAKPILSMGFLTRSILRLQSYLPHIPGSIRSRSFPASGQPFSRRAVLSDEGGVHTPLFHRLFPISGIRLQPSSLLPDSYYRECRAVCQGKISEAKFSRLPARAASFSQLLRISGSFSASRRFLTFSGIFP